ncbi:MAG: hypothetical protein INR64_03470 [Caulobacteraceae bacterium]|nr:hypothetical protein [Caulobacter sp.]
MEMDWGALFFFAFLAAVIIVPQVLKSQDRKRMYDTLRTAYEKGQPVPPEMLEAMTRRSRYEPGAALETFDPNYAAHRDLRRAVVWLAIGLGFVLIGVCFYAGLYNVGGSVQTLASFSAIGAIPACVGLAFLGLWFFGSRRTPPRA